jgi:hypothetical protein
MRLRLALAAAALGLLAVPVPASAAFCDILHHSWHAPKKPRSCEFDWGGAIGMTRRGRVKFQCVSDSMFNNHVLKYGRTWHNGRFTCRSRTTGLRCTNAAGHGFRVSRQKLVRF